MRLSRKTNLNIFGLIFSKKQLVGFLVEFTIYEK